MPNVSSAAAAELAQQLQTHHSIMTESILAKRKELNRIEDEVDEVNKAFRNAKKNLGRFQSKSRNGYTELSAYIKLNQPNSKTLPRTAYCH